MIVSKMPDSKLNRFIAPVLILLTSTIIWMVFLFVIPSTVDVNWPNEFWIKQAIFLFILVLFYNLNAYWFMRKLLYQDKTIWYIIVLLASLAFILIAIEAVEHALNLRELLHNTFRPNTPFRPRASWFRFDFTAFLLSGLVFGLSTAIELVRKGQKDALVRKELEKQKVTSELSFLKAQINPHFYFNTLNNIYALTATNAESARAAIHKLSRMMRYVIYETEKEKTLVNKEIAFIENYIEIMKLRLSEKVQIQFEKPTKESTELIAPMILLPFVENAFKHGISTKQPSDICIQIQQEGNQLILKVKNKKFKKTGLDIEEKSGIGLNNTKRRLMLLYPDNHHLNITEDGDTYKVNLSIELK